MASNTENMQLYKKDPLTDGNDTFDIETMMNDNWDKIDEELGAQIVASPAKTPVSLVSGQQVITSPRVTPYNVVSIKGQTRVNIAGRAGGFETYPSVWAGFNASFSLDTTAPSTGTGAYKVTIAADKTAGNINNNLKQFAVTSGKKYIAVIDAKNGNASQCFFYAASGGVNSSNNTAATSWTTLYKVFTANSATLELGLSVSGAAGQYAYYDSLRVYEITDAEATAISSMTPTQVAAKYPYVDDAKPINSPYVIKSGENLLPPLYEWETKPVNQIYAITDGGYTGTVTADGTTQQYTTTLPCIPGQAYTISGDDIVPAGVAGVAYNIQWQDAAKNYISEFSSSNSNDGGNSIGTMVAPANAAYMTVRCVCRPAVSSGLFKFSRPMLNLGDTALPFKPREDDYLILPAKLHSNIDRSVYDEITYRDGKYFKNTRFKEFELDGSLPWVFGNNYSGYKFVSVPGSNIPGIILTTDENDPVTAIKYDGKILANHISFSTYGADCFNADGPTSNLALSLSDADTGWGPSYVPTQAEMQAYFWGWKMYVFGAADPTVPYTSGTKGWCYRGSDGQLTGGTSTLPTTASPAIQKGGYYGTPYKLIYQLATPTTEVIPVEGGITLHEGLNQLEVGAGMIVREKATHGYTPQYNTEDVNAAYSNGGGVYGAPFRFRTDKILSIYKNDILDALWTKYRDVNAYGKERAFVQNASVVFDKSASYTVTYLTLDLYLLTGPVQAIDGEYSANLKTTVDTLARSQADVLTRVSVLETQKAGKEQPQWIEPTLLNGWVNVDVGYERAGYFKDDNGFVHVRGFIKSGNGASATSLFVLPMGYRPLTSGAFPAMSSNNSTLAPIILETRNDGRVLIGATGSASNGWLEINFMFLAGT